MKLYHCRDSRSLRPLWALEEMGLSYERVNLEFPPRVYAKTYLGVNPLGTVPYLIDGETRMTESVAICHYMVERHRRHDLGFAPDHPEYGAYLNWLYRSDATLTFPQTIVLRYRHMESPQRRLAPAVEDYRAFFLGRLKLLTAHLEQRSYLCAERFSIADICVGYALFLGSTPLLDLAGSYAPQLRDYLARLTARPAFQRAVAMGAPVGAIAGAREPNHTTSQS